MWLYVTWDEGSQILRIISFNFNNKNSGTEQETAYIKNTAVMRALMEKDTSGTSEQLPSFPAKV